MRKTRNWNTCHGYCIVPAGLAAPFPTRRPPPTHTHSWIWNRNRNRHLPSACALTRSLHSFVHSLMHLFILMSFPTYLPPAAYPNSLILIAAATLEPWQLMASEYWLKPIDSGSRRRRRHFKLTLWLHSALGRTWSWINYATLVLSCLRLLAQKWEEIELWALLHNLFSFNKRPRHCPCERGRWFLHLKLGAAELFAWRWRD